MVDIKIDYDIIGKGIEILTTIFTMFQSAFSLLLDKGLGMWRDYWAGEIVGEPFLTAFVIILCLTGFIIMMAVIYQLEHA